MYNIYDLIKNGATADDLAKAFTEEMNSAMKRINEEAKANQKETEFKAAMKPLEAWVKKYYGDATDLGEAIWETIEGLDEISQTLNDWLST